MFFFMSLDYSELGLRAGLEVHQQIESSRKLFCNCPAVLRGGSPDLVVERRLRASAGEGGVVDVAAAYEQVRGKRYEYRVYRDSVCAVELDEEPIGELDERALYVCLQVASLLKARPVDRVLVMRKTVVDGSNTSGFQRTALVARNGCVDLLSGKVRVSSICVEEDSAKVVDRGSDCDVYDLSRLGVPLVEIATEADIDGPEQLREVAEYVGMVLRSTSGVKRGIGTIRQDVNVSIRGGCRVEIKGAQDLRLLAKLVENEALRQKSLVWIAGELRKRNAVVCKGVVDVTGVFEGSGSKLVRGVLKGGGKVLALKLKGFEGLVGMEVQPGRRLGTEFSERAKAYGKVSGVIHSDELPGYGVSEEDVDKVNASLGCGDGDAFVFVAADEKKAGFAINAVFDRACQALRGVPAEVRKVSKDGTTFFLRPMSGSERMYPETDSKPVCLASSVETPELLSDVAGNYVNLGLGSDLAHSIVKSGARAFFDLMVEENGNVNPAFVAEVVISYPKEMSRRKLDYSKIRDEHLKEVFKALDKGEIAKESVMEVLAEVAAGQSIDLDKHRTMSDALLEEELRVLVADNGGLPFNVLIGKAMSKLRGRASGKKISDKLRELIK